MKGKLGKGERNYSRAKKCQEQERTLQQIKKSKDRDGVRRIKYTQRSQRREKYKEDRSVNGF